jgi:hypothetical protein
VPDLVYSSTFRMSSSKPWWDGKEVARIGEYAPAELSTAKLQMLVDTLRDGGPPVSEYDSDGTTDRTLDQLTQEFVALGARVVERNTSDRGESGGAIAVWGSGIVFVRRYQKGAAISFALRDGELFEKCVAITDASLEKHRQGDVFTLTGEGGPLELRRIGNAGLPLVRGNYQEEILEKYDRAVTGLASTEPHGRLVIVDGPPGVGKTYMVRGMLQEVPNTTFLLVPASMIDDITGPSLLPALLDARDSPYDGNPKRLVLVVEDADAALVPRASDNVALISALLNLGDGILGHTLDLRLIVTTNAKSVDIDPALVRPGRLLERIAIGPLPPAEASRVYERIAGKVDPSPHRSTLAELYARASESA